MNTQESQRAARLELILQQLEALPTLPAVATRLLQLTGSDDSDARQVIDLVESDQALTAKVLAMCRTAEKGLNEAVTTVDRAVLLLGFEAIRNAVLSIKVLEVFADEPEPGEGPVKFSVAAFWRHSLAVAIASEMIAAAARDAKELPPSEAFVCGLLHDVGKLALEHLLPKSYQRVVELTEQHQMNIADIERRVIGLDHQTVGKRLAEHWQLPHVITDSIWLHGAPLKTMPAIDHRKLVAVVGLADLIVRRQHIGYSGNYRLNEDPAEMAKSIGLSAATISQIVDRLHEELERRAAAMGLGHTPSRKLFLESIMQANEVLGQLNRKLDVQRRTAVGQGRALEAIARFHAESTGPGRTISSAVTAVAHSAAGLFGDGQYGVLFQAAPQQPWLLMQFNRAGKQVKSEFVTPGAGARPLASYTHSHPVSAGLMGLFPWIGQHLASRDDLPRLNVLQLPCGWGAGAMLVHDQTNLAGASSPAQLEAMRHTWGAAIAAAAQHQGARRLAEQLASSNRQLVETQSALAEHQSMVRLGEMAAGAAHEMNNPLAIIAGRAQLLSQKLAFGSKEKADAELIWQQADRLSELITALRLFAEPPQPKITKVNGTDVLEDAVIIMKRRVPQAPAIRVSGIELAPLLTTDREHLAASIAELLINAAESQPKTAVRVQASVDPLSDRLIILVKDDGVGMNVQTLEHAFDPFFSAKPAGRQVGLGLARARRLVESLGGEIELSSQPDRGCCARLAVPIRSLPRRETESEGASREVNSA